MWKLDLKNTYFSQETSTSSFAFGLVWDQRHEYSQNF